MATTTIRIEDDLKARVTAVAARAGKTPHAFIVDTIARTVERIEADEAFHRIAAERWAALLTTGKAVSCDDGRNYLAARARGERPAKPKARKLAR